MNEHEQRAHRSVTQALDKRLTDAETLIMALDKRQTDLTEAVSEDLMRLKSAGENSYFEERQDREAAILTLSQQVADLQAWRARTYRQKARDFFRIMNPWTTAKSSSPLP